MLGHFPSSGAKTRFLDAMAEDITLSKSRPLTILKGVCFYLYNIFYYKIVGINSIASTGIKMRGKEKKCRCNRDIRSILPPRYAQCSFGVAILASHRTFMVNQPFPSPLHLHFLGCIFRITTLPSFSSQPTPNFSLSSCQPLRVDRSKYSTSTLR